MTVFSGSIGAAAEPTGEPPQAAAGGSAGAPPSNTAPAKYPDGPLSVFRSGVDSLYLSFRGTLKPEWEARLAQLKVAAQSPETDTLVQAQVKLGGHLLQVKDRGRGRFPYVLADNWFNLALAASTSRSLPVAHVQIGNEPLVLEGPIKAAEALTALVSELANIEGPPLVSRVDLCTDFASNIDLEQFQEHHWISRARSRAKRYENGRFTGWSWGLGGAIAARLYNKWLEARKNGKTYMFDVWAANGWPGDDNIWRLEFQLRREALKELLVIELADLLPNCERIWRYCCQQWLRLSAP